MPPTARVLALLLLLAFARLATADTTQQQGDIVPPMHPPIILEDDPNLPLTYIWPSADAWPLSDDDDALAKAYAADEAVYNHEYVPVDLASDFKHSPQGEACLGCRPETGNCLHGQLDRFK